MSNLKTNAKHSRLDRLVRSIEVIGLILAAMFSGTSGTVLASSPTTPLRGLGSAVNFQVLGGSTVTNTGATVVAGEVGTSPGTTITGFPPGLVTEGGKTHNGDALALQAQSDVTLAYNSSAGQPCNTHLVDTDLGGKTLTPDVYCFVSLAQLTGQVVFDAQGDAAAVWIIQIPGGFSTASNASVSVINGGGVCNVFWIVGESATIGANSSFAGNILALTSITLATGTSLSGRALARNGAVTLDTNTISKPPCAQSPSPTPVPTSVPTSSHVSVEYQCANDGRIIVVVGLTAGVIVSGLGEDITSATDTGNNKIVRYLSPGHYEWQATPPAGSVLDVDNHGVIDIATCTIPTAVPIVAPVIATAKPPNALPIAGADLSGVQPSATQMMGANLGLLSLGFLSLGLGLIVFALKRK